MKYLILCVLACGTFFNGSAQTEKEQNKLAETIFSNFKKNRLDKITDLFVDSIFLDQIIDESIKKEELLTQKFSREKIHKQSKKAKAQLMASLQKAYERINSKGIEEKLRSVKPKIEFTSKKVVPVKTFDIKYSFLLDDYDMELRIPLLMYDEKRSRFHILSNRVRSYVMDPDTEIAEVVKIREREELTISDDIEMDVAPPPPPPPPRKIEEAEIEEMEIVDVPEPAEEAPVQIAEKMPEFPGGEKKMYEFIIKHLRYPEIARENDIQGRVYVSFVVAEDGSLQDVKTIRGIGYGCDEEAMRVILRMPKWKPGMQRGKNVKVRYTLPFNFKLK